MEQQTLALEYNSKRNNLTIAEHGRHVQKLIEHAKTIEDEAKRNEFVYAIVDLMEQMNPNTKNDLENRNRLWRHLFRIADYEIDVTPPEGISKDRPAEVTEVIPHLPYPQQRFAHRHYGKTIQDMIKKAIAMEDEEKKQGFTQVIASYMKLAYNTWNKEHMVNDEIIKSDLKKISKGELELDEDFNIARLSSGSKRSSGRGRGSNNRGRSNSSNNRGRSNNNNRGRNNNRKRK